MKFKKKLLFLCFFVILIVPYLYYSVRWNASASSGVKGPPYVDGWNQNTSRDVNDYISKILPPHIIPKGFCQKGGLLLVMINIKPDSFEVRNVIRETWGQERDNVSFYFLVGENRSHHDEVQDKLKSENLKYNDVIQERFIDSYNNLTLKSINMLKLFTRHCAKAYKYLMKIDDDVFLNVQNVLDMLLNRKTVTDLLVGKLINNTKPFRDPSSKWYVPYELFPEESYPEYLCGSTYLMSADVVQKLYSCTLETPVFYIEDVYITGICAKKIKISPRHNPNFKCQYTNKYICRHRTEFSIHLYTPEEMRKSHAIMTENKCPSSGSVMEWIWSLFF